MDEEERNGGVFSALLSSAGTVCGAPFSVTWLKPGLFLLLDRQPLSLKYLASPTKPENLAGSSSWCNLARAKLQLYSGWGKPNLILN